MDDQLRGHLESTPAGFAEDPIRVLRELAAAHGPIVRFPVRGVPVYLVSDPPLIHQALTVYTRQLPKRQMRAESACLLGQGLMTSEGELNRVQRRRLRTLFSEARMREWEPVVRSEARACMASWREGERLETLTLMGRLTLRVAAACLLGDRLDQAEQLRQALEDTLESGGGAQLRALVDAVTEQLMARGEVGQDMVSMLLRWQREDPDVVTDQQIKDEVVTMLLGAHETTATAVALGLRLLSSVAGSWEASDVLAETLRLYPPGWIIGRSVAEPVQLGGVDLEVGGGVLMCTMVTHYDERYWPSPYEFRLGRFATPPAKGSYFPFGGGDRVCIGERFAWMEGEILLEEIGRRWRLEPLEPLELRPLAALRPRGSLPARLLRNPG